MSVSPVYGVAPNAIRVNMPSPAMPATMPATPAAFRKFRRETGGMCGQPQGLVATSGRAWGEASSWTCDHLIPW